MEINFQKVIIWVLLVLLAGFIGQFGKSLSVALINKLKKKRKPLLLKPEEGVDQFGEGEVTGRVSAEDASLPDGKIQKKLAKVKFKMIKKGDGDGKKG